MDNEQREPTTCHLGIFPMSGVQLLNTCWVVSNFSFIPPLSMAGLMKKTTSPIPDLFKSDRRERQRGEEAGGGVEEKQRFLTTFYFAEVKR